VSVALGLYEDFVFLAKKLTGSESCYLPFM